MKRLLLAITMLCVAAANAAAADAVAWLKQHAIPFTVPDSLTRDVYTALEPFSVVMVGEMHGTQEPAAFVRGLTDLFVANGDSVLLGLELPETDMAGFLESRTDSSIYQSAFFNRMPVDGRESFSWARIISASKANPRIKLFFYDVPRGTDISSAERDSFMYVRIKEQYLQHPGWKMVTLSGNIHNMTSPEAASRGRTAAALLLHDTALHLADKLCSISHIYAAGEGLNNRGDGLKVHNMGGPPSFYSTTITAKSYLLLWPPGTNYPYNAVFYTERVTAATTTYGNADMAALRAECAAIMARDQKARKGTDSAQYVRYIDSTNLLRIESIIDRYGWPGRSLAGGDVNYTAWLVVQHAGIEAQDKYLPMLQRSVLYNESRPVDLVYLEDRIRIRRGGKQLYGTQVVFDETGAQVFAPIEDEKHVNVRRKAMGLEPLEEYGRRFGINYVLPAN